MSDIYLPFFSLSFYQSKQASNTSLSSLQPSENNLNQVNSETIDNTTLNLDNDKSCKCIF
ncbi:unnamed protein product [Schistosoma curassoni]|uniref:Uncharacterized protein n=1 Tax=Schistosoma curassoni TaxID=6186 RepID=A0A3P8DJV5_9TREM|nr:unnamed protein product [Schistosoma curassoni]